MDLGTGLAILGPSLSVGGIAIAIVGKLLPLGTDRPRSGDTSKHVGRPEFEQYCENTNIAFTDIKRMLGGIEGKIDKNLAEVFRRTEDHEKRIGIIEARHYDYTGDDIGPQSRRPVHDFRERRVGEEKNTHERRRETDKDGVGGDGSPMGPG